MSVTPPAARDGTPGKRRPRFDRTALVHAGLVVFALALVFKAAKVQLWEGKMWAARADRQHFANAANTAPRGPILDGRGVTLVESRELLQLRVAPRQLRDRKALRKALGRAGVNAQWTARAVDTKRAWVELPGRFLPTDVAPVLAMRGVYPQAVGERVSIASDGLRRVVGRLGADGNPVDGVELALDSVLRGEIGTATVLKDAHGRRFASPSAKGTAATPGNTVMLTINATLQGICERALGDAVLNLGAEGGDVVVLDPHDGAVLAMASRRQDPRSTASTALTEPFEPGSTLKPFFAAALLARGRARADEVMNTHNGTYVLDGRTITDEHKAPQMTLAEVLANSSNIGIVQFAARLSAREEYETLRDIGLGTPTLVSYPSEAAGTLREPDRWSKQSAASLAMGYEVAVTPMQLAAAYASIANGGELLQPALIKEVRDADGTVLYEHERRVVRRVMPETVARQLRTMLAATVENGTAVDADMSVFDVAGKTGTARRTRKGQGYTAHSYTASFVGMFPADAPQYVILVKIDNPSSTIFGGKAAAPVSRVVLEAAIAARDAALDRGELAAREKVRPLTDTSRSRSESTLAATPRERTDTATPPFVVNLAQKPVARRAPMLPRAVPDVHGLPLRQAVFALHQAGFRVQLVRTGSPGSWPAAGTSARPGSVVKLFYAG
jgi:cell division protein FtsI (penicillin-binding protein 3)